MTKIFLFVLLSILFSCGNDSDNSSGEPMLEMYQDALHSQRVGMVIEKREKGMKHHIDYDLDSNTFTTKKVEVNELDRNIILKIDGDLIYELQEDDFEGEIRKSVILVSITKEVEWNQELLGEVRFVTQGNRIVGNIEMPEMTSLTSTSDDQKASIKGKATFSLSFAKDNMLCDGETNIVKTNQVFTTSNLSLQLEDISLTTITSCPEILSPSELKKFDLHRIKFCDQSKGWEVYNCEYRDMLFLTSDL